MDKLDDKIARRFAQGDPFDVPEHPDLFELYVGWFFDRIRAIVAVENHIYKWKGVDNTIDLLHESAEIAKVNVIFEYSKGQWYVDGFQTKEDFLNLPAVARIFSRLYRFQIGQSKNPKEELKNGGRIHKIN